MKGRLQIGKLKLNDFRYIEDELGNGKIERYYVNDRQNDRDALGKIRVSLLIRFNPLVSRLDFEI